MTSLNVLTSLHCTHAACRDGRTPFYMLRSMRQIIDFSISDDMDLADMQKRITEAIERNDEAFSLAWLELHMSRLTSDPKISVATFVTMVQELEEKVVKDAHMDTLATFVKWHVSDR